MIPMGGDIGLPGSRAWHNKCGVVLDKYTEHKSCTVIDISTEISKEGPKCPGNVWQVKI